MSEPQKALVPLASKVEELDSIVSEFGLATVGNAGGFSQALAVAEGIRRLEGALTAQVMEPIMALQGTRLGFLTDKDRDGGYPDKIIRRCLIEAVLRGARPVGNEFNVIAGNAYYTKEYFVRQLRELPGLTDLRIDLSVPKNATGGAIVPAKASWKLNGVSGNMEADIPVKVNDKMGADAILGKAERKIRARVFNRLTGSEFPEGDVSDLATEEKVVGSGSTNGGTRTVGMPTAKESNGATEPAEPDPPAQTVPDDQLQALQEIAEEKGVPPLAVAEKSRELYGGKNPAQLAPSEFEALLKWAKGGGA